MGSSECEAEHSEWSSAGGVAHSIWNSEGGVAHSIWKSEGGVDNSMLIIECQARSECGAEHSMLIGHKLFSAIQWGYYQLPVSINAIGCLNLEQI